MESLQDPKHKEKLLKAISVLPMATTKQLGKLMGEVTQPEKKASYYLKQAEAAGWTRSQYFQREKLWSLTPKGRKQFRVSFPRTKTLHTLAVGNVYFDLAGSELTRFDFEPRYEYKYKGEKLVYAPDAVLMYKGKLCIIEVQITPYSKNQWSSKWRNANVFFSGDCWKQHFLKRPNFIAITSSSKEVVSHGFNVPERRLHVLKDISELRRGD